MSYPLLLPSLAGGLLIGLAATLLLLFNGRIAGISNILSGVWTRHVSDRLWRVVFLFGLLSGGMIILLWRPESFGPPPTQHSPGLSAIAGLLVGLGACLSNGCTSGHGVCGLGRRSLRSLMATLTFMTTGIMTVAVMHYFGR